MRAEWRVVSFRRLVNDVVAAIGGSGDVGESETVAEGSGDGSSEGGDTTAGGNDHQTGGGTAGRKSDDLEGGGTAIEQTANVEGFKKGEGGKTSQKDVDIHEHPDKMAVGRLAKRKDSANYTKCFANMAD
jgi:hypothetical protein